MTTQHQPPPLAGVRVVEFAGLAPGPFAGMLLADYGASVLRVDRAVHTLHTLAHTSPTTDQLTRRKSSICVNIQSGAGLALLKNLLANVDVVIDPFRPGVLEKAGLDPVKVLLRLNPRLIVARLTGFRRDGKYAHMAGHDINYIAVSGVLSLFGRQGDAPFPPANVVGDFAGGGAMCVLGILLALLARQRSGHGQVVEANMVDGSAMLATMPRLGLKTALWNGERGTNLLDGGAPFYTTYETKDGGYLAVGALEPRFFVALLNGLGRQLDDLPGDRDKQADWPRLRAWFAAEFKTKTRAEWEAIFDGTDACCTPVLTHAELEQQGFDQRPAVTLTSSPGYAIHEGGAERPAAQGQGTGCQGSGWTGEGLKPGKGGEHTLSMWMGWVKGKQYVEEEGGLVWRDNAKL